MDNERQSQKPRVLVTGVCNKYGGTETVVSRFIRELSDRFAFDTISHAPYKQEEYSQGDNRVIVIPAKRMHPVEHAIELRRFFNCHADDYCALWHNANSFSNIDVLDLAEKANIPVRICHFHNTQILGNTLNKALSELHRKRVARIATVRLACSQEAGKFAFAENSFQVLNNAFSVSEFTFNAESRAKIRKEFELANSFVIGNVGRLAEQKNQECLIRALPNILEVRPDAMLVLVGDGALKHKLEREASLVGVASRVRFAGVQKDVASFFSAFDVFAFPSTFEGLGVAVVEAQANGLPCVISDKVPTAAIVSESVRIIPADFPKRWAEEICKCSRDKFIKNELLMERFEVRKEANVLAHYFGD